MFKIKMKKFIPEVVGVYFTAGGDTVYKIVYVEDGNIRFAHLENNLSAIVISNVKFKMDEFYRNLKKGSLIQVDSIDHRIPLSLLSYEMK